MGVRRKQDRVQTAEKAQQWEEPSREPREGQATVGPTKRGGIQHKRKGFIYIRSMAQINLAQQLLIDI